MKKSRLTRMTALMFAAAVGTSMTGCHDQIQPVYGPPDAFETEPQDVYGPPDAIDPIDDTSEEITTESPTATEITTEITTTTAISTESDTTQSTSTDDVCEYDPELEQYQCVYGPPEVMTGTTIAPQTVPPTTEMQTTIQTAPDRYQYETLDPFLETSYEPLDKEMQVVTPPADCEDGHCIITAPPAQSETFVQTQPGSEPRLADRKPWD